MIPGYTIQEEIFRSRKRVVFRGWKEPEKHPVIIKTISAEFPLPSDLSVLKREYEIIKNLNAEGIARVYGLEKYQKNLALVLQDIGGRTLRSLIDLQKQGQIPAIFGANADPRHELISILRIAIQITSAIGNVHQNNIIHKDINPRNIIVNPQTFQVELIDFSISSLLPRENQEISHPSLLEGTLAYMSPEQTGRMNRSIDYRTDFYSLGVTLYEMLTGKLPLYSPDMLEQVHWHIARNPIPLSEVNPAVPQTLSDIVMKLLSKNAEDRYNSALGLKADLESCLQQMESMGTIQSFVPGQHELHTRFNIPQKLYGRDKEIQILLRVFEGACKGTVEMMMVSGYSGIGKTSLIHEVHKPIVQRSGYFISGKFDQLNRVIPYSALIQAFQELIRQLLTESSEKIELWKKDLLEALGANCQIIIDVIPEVELITGKQPPVPQLGPTESQNRFNLVFQNFISVFAQEVHPLVLFLDDLQWADTATLKLFQNLSTGTSIHYLFLIGAYRDNEVTPSHPLILSLNEIEKSGALLSRISLAPLSIQDLSLFIADTLMCDTKRAMPLALLVMNKTGGNPFFVNQFLRSLYQENLIQFDYNAGEWKFDLERIERRDMTDNVVELMAGKIQKLTEATQHVLKLAACIANRFDLNTLSIVNEKSFGRTTADLWPAIQEGLIVPAGDVYEFTYDEPQDPIAEGLFFCRFLHDRVQQAAYDLIPDDRKKELHLKVGRLLFTRWNETQREERVFDIVNQLNMGSELMGDRKERYELAALNVIAGAKAKSSAAYRTALSYFQKGRLLLDDECWISHYDLAFRLYSELAQCEYFCGNFEEAENYFRLILQNAKSNLERASIHNLRIIQYENMARYVEAVEAGREGLRIFGVELPVTQEQKQQALQEEILTIKKILGERKIEELIHLPVMLDQEMKMRMKLLTTLWASAYIAGDALYPLLAARMVRLSLEEGNTEESAYGYVVHAITIGTGMGDFKSGYEFGRLALDVNDKFHDAKLRSKVHHMFSCFVNIWRKPIRTSFVFSKEAYRSGLETGDFTYATYGIFHESWYGLLTGSQLADFVKDYTPNLAFLKQIKNYSFYDAQQIILHWGLCLQGRTQSIVSFTDESFSEETYLETYKDDPFFQTFYCVAKLHVLLTFEKYPEALEIASKAEKVISALAGTIWQTLLCFFHSLILTALYGQADESQKRNYLEKLAELQLKMKIWADNCPENFAHFYHLVSAELARITGKNDQAMNFYEDAIRLAREGEIFQDEALANELYGKFWLQAKNQKIARVYLTEAIYGYRQWGALAKVKDLEERYPILAEKEKVPSDPLASIGPLFTTHTQQGTLDISAVLKGAQAISGEIVLEPLLQKLMKIVIENAGAQRGIMMLETEGREATYTEGSVDNSSVQLFKDLREEEPKFPASIVNFVRRTGTNLVVADASKDSRFAADPYVLKKKIKSGLCIPILHQAKTIGLLYLENNLASDVFTPDRLQLVQILASQAAISLENALLYEDMKQESLQRKNAEETLRSIMEGTASFTGSDFFQSLVKNLAHSLNLKYAFVTECTDSSNTELRTLAFWNGEGYGENFSYSVKGTPCEIVALQGKECFFPSNLQALFPEDTGLVDFNAHSYYGVPLLNSAGKVLGHVMVLDDREMTGSPSDFSILRIFAARASAELERIRAEAALMQTAAELRFVNDLIRQTNQPVAVSDFSGRLVRFNHAYEQLTGYSSEELRNLTYQELTPTIWHELEEKLITKLKKEEKPIRYEKEYRRKDGQIVPVELVTDIYKNETGESIFLYAFVTDITERKRAEKALREALTEVENLKNRLQAENIYLQEEIKTQHNFEEIIGSSTAIRRVFQSIERVARTDSTTLITGETGTGKELVARAIHNLSSRKESALIKVNCAALPAGLIESELFGHEKGAFTGASARKRGRFELADGGSLFLDEVGELPLETQTKLLRVLQEQEFERIGGAQTIKVNVRLIAATNRNLDDLVKQNSFRPDLYYRLNIFPIHLPALRERRDDIPLLTNYFVSRFSRTMGKKIDQVSSDALDSLIHYDWPGNVRELANVLERAVILCDGGVLEKDHIGISSAPIAMADTPVPSLNEAERLHILKALEKTKWVVGGPVGAAKLLGLNRTTLLARMKKLGISKPV